MIVSIASRVQEPFAEWISLVELKSLAVLEATQAIVVAFLWQTILLLVIPLTWRRLEAGPFRLL
jgi:hypothetical protein